MKFHTDAQSASEFRIAVARTARLAARKSDTKPSREPAKYAGTYSEPAYGAATVTEKAGVLTLVWGKFTFRLDHYHFDTYTAIPVEPKEEARSFDRSTFDAQFRLGTDGEVESLKFLDQEFVRTKK